MSIFGEDVEKAETSLVDERIKKTLVQLNTIQK